MSTNFNSLFIFAQSSGLGSGSEGVCHVMEFTMEQLVPRDVEAGRIHDEDIVRVYDYGTHQSFSVLSSTGEVLANARTLHTLTALANFLRDVYVDGTPTPHVEDEDDDLDAVLETIRQEAIAADLVEGGDDEDEIFQEDESDEDDLDLDLDGDSDDDTEDDDEEAEIISLVKPKAKKGTKKYKAEIDEMIAVLDEYYGDELSEAGIDAATMAEVLDEVFAQVGELNIDSSCPLLDQLSDYIEFE